MRLQIDPIACEAHGLCSEVLPERVQLDEWGYPIVDDRPISAELVKHAKRAARTCPRLAVKLRD